MSDTKTNLQYVRSLVNLLSKSDPYLTIASNYSPSPIDIYPHQVDLLSRVMFVRPIRILVGDEIGLGKTIESISILRYLEKIGELKRALIIVPRILTTQWVAELMKMGVAKHDIFVFGSGKDVKELKNKIENQKYFIISKELVRMENHLKKLLKINWDTIVVDEAHNVTLNSVKTKNAIQKLIKDTSRNVIFLSATPHRGVANDYLFRLRLLDPSLVEDYSKLDINPFYESTHDSLLFRRTKEVINNLQDKEVFKDCKFQLHLIQPTSEERAFMNALIAFLKRKAKELGENGVNTPVGLLLVLLRKRASSSPYAAMKTLRSMIKTLQKKQEEGFGEDFEAEDITEFEEKLLGEDYSVDIETDFDEMAEKLVKKYSKALKPEDIDEISRILKLAEEVSKNDSKLKAVKELVLELVGKNEGKVLVFTEYRDTLEYLKKSIESDKNLRNLGIRFETLSGKDRNRFEEVKRKFEDDPSVQVLIATDVASEGLNLQKANHMINYDAPWSPVKLEQRIGRIWRLGQQYISYVYNIFLSTDSDLAIVEKLYEKLLNIERAVGSTKPIIGEEVRVANLKASSDIWKAGEVGEIDYRGKKVRFTEHRMIYAELTDQLDEFVRAFLATIQSLNRELKSKNVFPIYSAKKIKNNLKRILGSDDLREYEQVLREMVIRIGHLEGKSTYEVSTLSHPVRILEYLRSGEEKSLPKLLFTTSESDSGIFQILKIQVNNREYFVGYDRGENRILNGVELLKFIARISKNGFSSPSSSIGMDRFESLSINQKSHIKNSIQRMIGDLLSPFNYYFRESDELGIRRNGWKVDLQIGEPELVSTIVVTRFEEGSEILDETLRKKIEMAAMEVSLKFEGSKGDVLKTDPEVHKTESFDILSYLKNGGNRFIEVKGHLGMRIYAELTPNEYELAEKLGEDYYLHLVINLHLDEYENITTSKAILLEFKDPLKSMRVKKVGGETRYLLFP
jgi:SNF2 family DNA or RNA helicase